MKPTFFRPALFFCSLLTLLLTLAVPSGFADTTVGGTISIDTTWTLAGSPYIVSSNITVQGADGADGITTLTIEPGVVVKFNRSRYMNIGASSGNPGALIAQGTSESQIVFTSNKSSPAPGDWYYVRFYNTTDDATTVMEHCIVEYGGYNSGQLYIYQASPIFRNVTVQNSKTYGAYIYNSEPVFENCTFGGNLGYDLYYRGTFGGSVTGCTINSGICQVANGTVSFLNNTINQNNAFPIKIYPDSVGEISASTFNNVDAASFMQINGGTVSQDATWTAAMPYAVTGNLIIKGTDGADGITTLTVQPGATLKFNQQRYINIGAASGDPGALVARGTASAPIVFTSNKATPAPGDWYGIGIYNTADDAATSLEHCVLEYTGYYGKGAVFIQDAAPTLSNCTFSNSSYYDLVYLGTVGGTVSGCSINNSIYYPYVGTVDFSGNTINYTNSRPIIAAADNVHNLVNGNTFNNLDAASYLKVNSANVTQDATWTAAIPLFFHIGLTVQGTDGADGITTLTIQPGATMKFASSMGLKVGAASGAPGALAAQGTAADPITFTSSQAAPAAGDWQGITINDTSDDTTTRLENCNIEYAGHSGNTNTAAVKITDAAPAIDQCTFSNSYYYDLEFTGAVGGAVSNCTINHGILLTPANRVDFYGNSIAYNNSFPIKASADNVHSLINGNTYSNLDAASDIKVTTGNVTRDATWTAAIPVFINSSVTVLGTDGADGVTTLSIEPGARIRFDRTRYLNIGSAGGAPGALIAQGTGENMILFTSSQAAPAAADWAGITFYPTAAPGSILEYSIVEYAGSSGQAVKLDNVSAAIRNCTIRNNSTYGVMIAGNTSTIQCNTFGNNLIGIYTVQNAQPDLQQNNFVSNSYYGLRNASTIVVTAENSWWGDIAGPNQGGDQTYGNVDTDPWSEQINICSTATGNNPPQPPAAPAPADNAVNVSASSSLSLTWSGGDPDPLDTVTYDIFIGTTADTMSLVAQAVSGTAYTLSDPLIGITYYWQVLARDNHGLETSGPLWRFTTHGDPPDLTISAVGTNPPGHLQTGQNVALTFAVENIGTGPVVSSFLVAVTVDGTSIGTPAVTDILLSGQSAAISIPWTYSGGNPGIDILADSQTSINETSKTNNRFTAQLFEVSDNTAPGLTATSPPDGAYLQHVNSISATLTDSQSSVDDTAVAGSFTVIDGNQQNVPGTVAEANDTFIFTPAVAPLADGAYVVSLAGADEHGNSQSFSFGFTVDSQPPAKPIITGGTVTSGLIQIRPAQNTSDQFVVELTGTRETDTSVWINGAVQTVLGDSPWSAQVTLQAGNNALEVWLKDRSGNQGASEWVDIQVSVHNAIQFDYNASGRVKRIETAP